MSDMIGKSIDRYHILEQLGEGGMATVYKAFDTRLERDVAIKIIRRNAFPPDQLDRILKRFEREAKSLARLSHPNIIKVIDYGEYNGAPYLVMEYMPGGTLKEKLKGRAMQWQEAVRLLIPIAQALEYAHEQKIIHRDIKPSNILLMQKGQPMLTDFGIAKIVEVEETATLTGTGVGVGTPEYMAPEQWTGSATAQTDIYSLGVVLYEMVTGRRPYTADTPAAILLKQATEALPRPGTYVSDLPDSVEKILLKALARKPENRYQEMGDFLHALNTLVNKPTAQKKDVLSNNLNTLDAFTSANEGMTYATVEQDDTQSTRLQKDETRDTWTSAYSQVPDRKSAATHPSAQRKSQEKKPPVAAYVIGGILGILLLFFLFSSNNSSGNYDPAVNNSGPSNSSSNTATEAPQTSSSPNTASNNSANQVPVILATDTPLPTNAPLPTNTPAPTYTPLPTYTQQPTYTPMQLNTAPIVDAIDLPQTIVCDGRRYDFPIYFHDSDGDANKIFWELINSKQNTTPYFTVRGFTIDAQLQMSGTAYNDWIEWKNPGDEVQIRVNISDSSNLIGWKDFKFTCLN